MDDTSSTTAKVCSIQCFTIIHYTVNRPTADQVLNHPAVLKVSVLLSYYCTLLYELLDVIAKEILLLLS